MQLDKTTLAMLKWLPCAPSSIPTSLRGRLVFVEDEGLATGEKQKDGSYVWKLTEKGRAVVKAQ